MIEWALEKSVGWYNLFMYKMSEIPIPSTAIFFQTAERRTSVHIGGEYWLRYGDDLIAIVPADLLPDKIKKGLDKIIAEQEAAP